MGTGIHLDATKSEKAIKELSDAITTIFMNGSTYNHDQSTICHAITVLGEAAGINNVSITGNSIVSKEFKMDED